MTKRIFVDTNVPLYALDTESTKQKAALAIMRGNPVISVQVVNEFISVVTKKTTLSRREINQLAGVMLRRCEVIAIDSALVNAAIALGEKFKLSHWDSLIVAAALQAECDVLYTEDLHNGQVIYSQLTIINPFLRS